MLLPPLLPLVPPLLQALGLVYTCMEGWLRVMYAAANGLTVEAVAARTDTLHLTLEQVSRKPRGK